MHAAYTKSSDLFGKCIYPHLRLIAGKAEQFLPTGAL